uniref:Secreted protein n=1 Tax=Anguilla anguilla TaxID=7936 RepID=A0A0E9RSN3_ANGAN
MCTSLYFCLCIHVSCNWLLSADHFDQTVFLVGVVKCPMGRIIDCGTGAFVTTKMARKGRKKC